MDLVIRVAFTAALGGAKTHTEPELKRGRVFGKKMIGEGNGLPQGGGVGSFCLL